MTILSRYPEFFQTCKKAFPHGGLDFAAMSNSDIDRFVVSYLTDLGGDSARLAYHLMMSHDEDELNNAYEHCSIVLDRLAQNYNDYSDLVRDEQHMYLTEERFDTKYSSPFQDMYDAGHDSERDF